MRYTIALGNAFDGIKFYGVFENQCDAIRRAEWLFQGRDWYIVSINSSGD